MPREELKREKMYEWDLMAFHTEKPLRVINEGAVCVHLSTGRLALSVEE